MSSHGLPTLFLDVRARRSERAAAAFVIVLAVAASTQLQFPAKSVALVAVGVAASLGLGFFLTGWIGGSSRWVRIACQPDDRWALSDTAGRTVETELGSGSRVTPFALWLEWKSRPGRPLLLLPGDIPATDFRRLVVRLRLGARNDAGELSHES